MNRLMVTAAGLVCVVALVACNSPVVQGNYGTITGTVTSSSGQPLAGAVVTIDFSVNLPPTGPDGKFTFTQAPVTTQISPDHVEVTTTPAGYQRPAAKDVQVQAGQTTVVNFTLAPS